MQFATPMKFLALLESLYVFLSTAKCHSIFQQQQKELHPDQQQWQLQRLSYTCWACRHGAVVPCVDAVLATLPIIVDGSDGAKAAEARGLLLQVKSFWYILYLVICDRVLSCTKSPSDIYKAHSYILQKQQISCLPQLRFWNNFRWILKSILLYWECGHTTPYYTWVNYCSI